MRDAFAAWIERDVVVARGPDTLTFLHGQMSQDIEALARDESRWSLLLSPAGKVDAWLRVTRVDDDEVELDVDAGFGAAVVARLERFKLRTKTEFAVRARQRVLAVRGIEIDSDGRAVRSIVWPGRAGADLFAADATPPDGVPITTGYERARIEAGVPAMGRELTDATIPVEAGQWLIDASVSFTKGCYTGQELVARIDARGGQAPRPVRGLRLSEPAVAGAVITNASGDTIGAVTSAADHVALAPLPRAFAPSAEVLVDGRSATVVDLPMA